MESPVRLCLGAALVVYLLLLSSTPAHGSALNETISTTVKYDRTSRFAKSNGTTWVPRSKPKTPDVALNELNPKESVSDEHTDKNAKYKDRGRVRFGQSQKTAALRSRIRASTTDKSVTESLKLMIVTPEPEKKNVSQIIDSMRVYKKTKLPVVLSSTTPLSVVKKEIASNEEEYEESEEKESIEKYTSTKFQDNFNIPGFTDDDDDFSHENKEETENRVHKEFRIPSYEKFSTYFPKGSSYSSKDDDSPYKSESYFHDFDSDLTTPKNDFFDKKFKEISSSIIKNLDSIKAKSNKTNPHKIIKENIDVSKFNKGIPTNKSSVFIKNTKQVRLLDNEGAGSANQELSDVQGTSIYYEMSVLSTETYNVDNSDDDCENDTIPFEPTPSTTNEEEIASLPGSSPLVLTTTSPPIIKISTKSISSPTSTTIISTSQNSIQSTEEALTTTKVFSSTYGRNRSFKWFNFNGTKDHNRIPPTDQVTKQSYRPVTRVPAKFHFTTPKNKPIWMAPTRDVTRNYRRTTYPTTIYSEHFNIRDKQTSTPQIRQPYKALTTQTSDIDPVLQSEVAGVKKVVHSQTILDNSIPTLWKRGSAKFQTTTEALTETGATSDLEIPPTLTAWALASMRSPPSFATSAVNGTGFSPKSVDENELQNVGDTTEKKDTTATTTSTTTTTTTATTTTKVITEINHNKLASQTTLQPLYEPMSSSSTLSSETETTYANYGSNSDDFEYDTLATVASEEVSKESERTTEMITEANTGANTEVNTEAHTEAHTEANKELKSESLPAESNISVQNSDEPVTTEAMRIINSFQNTDISAADFIGLSKPSFQPPPWWSEANTSNFQNTTIGVRNDTTPRSTKSSGFESITKLPSGITTPQGDDIIPATKAHEIYPGINTALPTTTDYEITTFRSPYVPLVTDSSKSIEEERITTYDWRPILPTRTTIVQGPTKVANKFADAPITTYRPLSVNSDEQPDEMTTLTPVLTSDVTSKVTEASTVAQIIQNEGTTPQEVQTSEETATIDEDIVTEKNVQTKQTTTSYPGTELNTLISASEENSDSNEVITQTNPKNSTEPPLITTIETKQIITIPQNKSSDTTTTSSEPEEIKDRTTKNQEEIETTTKFSTTLITGGKVYEDATEVDESTVQSTTDPMLTTSSSELEASSGILSTEEAGSGAAVAITVSTIGVITLILLVGLLLVVRRRGRRGIYAQRCTPVSLDAYSLDSVSVGQRKGNHHLRASKRSYGNPAFDDEVTSHPMQYAALANFALDVELMTNEFTEIPSVTVRPDDVPPGCEDKNRYSNILPLPETRVPLQRIGNDPTTEYINANFITGPGNIKNYYIACQAPLQNTVCDLWRMVWEQNSRLIVMLTEYMENGVEKCYEYLPPSEVSDNKRTFGDFQVVLKKREQHDKYAVSTVQLLNLNTRTWREVTHMWYFWPAKGVPDDYDSVIDFLTEMRSYMKISQTAKEFDEDGVEVIYEDQSRSSFHNLSKLRSEDKGSGNGVHVYSPARAEEQLRRGNATNGTLGRMKVASEIEGVRPCVVMCASGAGRAAALVALDVCARALAAGRADVPRVVRELRQQRPHALANRHHYIFVYKVLSEYGNKLMGGGDNI